MHYAVSQSVSQCYSGQQKSDCPSTAVEQLVVHHWIELINWIVFQFSEVRWSWWRHLLTVTIKYLPAHSIQVIGCNNLYVTYLQFYTSSSHFNNVAVTEHTGTTVSIPSEIHCLLWVLRHWNCKTNTSNFTFKCPACYPIKLVKLL